MTILHMVVLCGGCLFNDIFFSSLKYTLDATTGIMLKQVASREDATITFTVRVS